MDVLNAVTLQLFVLFRSCCRFGEGATVLVELFSLIGRRAFGMMPQFVKQVQYAKWRSDRVSAKSDRRSEDI